MLQKRRRDPNTWFHFFTLGVPIFRKKEKKRAERLDLVSSCDVAGITGRYNV